MENLERIQGRITKVQDKRVGDLYTPMIDSLQGFISHGVIYFILLRLLVSLELMIESSLLQ